MSSTEQAKKTTEEATASRAVTVFALAPGLERTVPAGSLVRILERKPNGTLVVLTDDGCLGHVSRTDADAFSPIAANEAKPPSDATPKAPPAAAAPSPTAIDEKEVWARLRTVFDPEMPMSIVDLGLVYECKIVGSGIEIRMTLTAPGCPVGDDIRGEIETKLRQIPGVERVSVDFVWDPPWSREKMSDAAKLQLGLL